uniref:carbohydrate sulfotransferase 10-like n=1 Tax=Styela clava TaxID=7725 RepID=UPI00193938AA|nr:carbohydrate sulfotransferase 10-like [Styela clava]
MIRRRRGILLLSGISISIFFLLHEKISSNISLSPSNEQIVQMHEKFETADKSLEGMKEAKKESSLEEEIPHIKKEPINRKLKNSKQHTLPRHQNEEMKENINKVKNERLTRKATPKKNILTQKSQLFQADPENDAKTAARFQKRVKTMKSRCPAWKHSPFKKNWVVNKNFLINYPRRLLICAVPKAGSTSWHMTIWAMRRIQAGLDPNTTYYTYEDTVENHHTAEKLSTNKGKEMIYYNEGDDDMYLNPPTAKARRLLLTRHPFARMISGWHQKFLPYSSYADLMFKRYPTLKSYVREKDPNHRMSWKDFAEFVADTGTRPQSLDYHFTPTVEICKPCDYAYTYILKAESVDIDESWLLRRLNITDIDVGRKGVPPGGSIVNANPSDNIKKHMSQLKSSVRRKLYDVYKEDFLTFGYTFDFRTLNSGGFD